MRRLSRDDDSAYLPMIHAASASHRQGWRSLAAALAAAGLRPRELSEMVAIVNWFEVARAYQIDGRALLCASTNRASSTPRSSTLSNGSQHQAAKAPAGKQAAT